MLTIKDLHASVGEKEILKGINLEIKPGEVHAIMGPNGSGKSTLSAVLAGRETFNVTSGEIIFKGRSIVDLTPEERSWAGIFLGFQYPIEIPGVTNVNFIKAAGCERRVAAVGVADCRGGEHGADFDGGHEPAGADSRGLAFHQQLLSEGRLGSSSVER